jgi:hypothetical protein
MVYCSRKKLDELQKGVNRDLGEEDKEYASAVRKPASRFAP